jgi:KRAB domain-containing zinc finger protein
MKPFQCIHCKKKFSLKSHLLNHISAVHSNMPFNCDKCTSSFLLINELMIHNSTMHNKLYDFKCKLCFRKFKKKQYLISHIKIVHRTP